jgi:hypothetical protein
MLKRGLLRQTSGYWQLEVELQALTGELGEDQRLLPVLISLSVCYVVRGRSSFARELAEQADQLARAEPHAELRQEANLARLVACFHLGELAETREHLTRALQLVIPKPRDARSRLPPRAGTRTRDGRQVTEVASRDELVETVAQRGKADAARCLLEGIYGWFNEGHRTEDLEEARAELERLGAQPGQLPPALDAIGQGTAIVDLAPSCFAPRPGMGREPPRQTVLS